MGFVISDSYFTVGIKQNKELKNVWHNFREFGYFKVVYADIWFWRNEILKW